MSSSVQPGGGAGNIHTHTHTHNFSFSFFLSHTQTQRQLPQSMLGRIFHLSPADLTVTHCKDSELLKRLPQLLTLFFLLFQRYACGFKREPCMCQNMCSCSATGMFVKFASVRVLRSNAVQQAYGDFQSVASVRVLI